MESTQVGPAGSTGDSTTPRRAMLVGLGGFAAGTFLAAHPAQAGTLDPPGAPGPTAKPLRELEPRIAINSENTPGDDTCLFRISQPGSYYLTAPINAVAGRHGIGIDTSHVTIDLRGFTMTGSPMSLSGIATRVNCEDVMIRNGIVRSWNESGINLMGGSIINARIEGIAAVSNGRYGIRGGSITTVRNSVAYGNGLHGIWINEAGLVEGCTAANNQQSGILAGEMCRVFHCVTKQNHLRGIEVNHGSSIVECVAGRNENCGITCSGMGVLVSRCSIWGNMSAGINASNQSLVADCTTLNNKSHGIYLVMDCVAQGNHCELNGSSDGVGAGVFCGGANNRVVGNYCARNTWGVRVIAGQNLIVGNACSNNSAANWDITNNNVVGPILDRRTTGSGAILGNSAPSSMGTTDPWANFTH